MMTLKGNLVNTFLNNLNSIIIRSNKTNRKRKMKKELRNNNNLKIKRLNLGKGNLTKF